MKVRNHLIMLKEYKGRWTDASNELCPCRVCYSPHDCGYLKSGGIWHTCMECVTRYRNGCPDDFRKTPTHVFKNTKKFQKRKRTDHFKCLRCHQYIDFNIENIFNFEINK